MIEEDFVELPLHPSGVYLLMLRGVVVYVGQSVNVLFRISKHRNNWERHVSGRRRKIDLRQTISEGRAIEFDRVKVFFCEPRFLDKFEQRFITQYKPALNIQLTKRVPLNVKIDLEALGFKPNYRMHRDFISPFDTKTTPRFRRPRMAA